MKPAEIWRFESAPGSAHDLKVILRIQDLGLSLDHPMRFINRALLVQILLPVSAPHPSDEVEPLINGAFLMPSVGRAKRAGFRNVETRSISLKDVEFPCWLIEDSAAGLLFCRGELIYPIRRPDAAQLYRKWDIRLSAAYPDQLGARVARFAASSGANSGEHRVFGIPGSDIRYHPCREEILSELGVDISSAYLGELRRLNEARCAVYERLLEDSLHGAA